VFLSLGTCRSNLQTECFFLRLRATLSNSELKTSLALSAVAKLISKRILSPSTTNWIIASPREAGISLTVRTPAWSIAARISFKWFSSVELTNRIRQSGASCGLGDPPTQRAFPLALPLQGLNRESSQKDPGEHTNGEGVALAGRKSRRPFDELPKL